MTLNYHSIWKKKMVVAYNVYSNVFVYNAQFHIATNALLECNRTVWLHGSLLFIVTVDFAAITAFSSSFLFIRTEECITKACLPTYFKHVAHICPGPGSLWHWILWWLTLLSQSYKIPPLQHSRLPAWPDDIHNNKNNNI